MRQAAELDLPGFFSKSSSMPKKFSVDITAAAEADVAGI
jgi:hypothetical protein